MSLSTSFISGSVSPPIQNSMTAYGDIPSQRDCTHSAHAINDEETEFSTTPAVQRDLASIGIDYSVAGNRLYKRTDDSIGIAEKSIGYVIGEKVLFPTINLVSSLTKNVFNMMSCGFGYLKTGLSSNVRI